MTYWIKVFTEMLDDPKMGALSDSAFRRFIELMLLAKRTPPHDSGELPDLQSCAWLLRISAEQLQTDIAELERGKHIVKKGDCYVIRTFKKRQAPVTDAERAKQYRKRKYHATVTKRDANVTLPLQSRDGETETETETETENARAHTRAENAPQNQPQIENFSPAMPDAYLGLIPTHISTESFLAAWNDWIEYHAERGKPLTKSTAKAQLRELGQLPPGEGEQRIQQSIAQGWTGLFELKSSKNGQHGDSDLWPQLLSLMKQSAPALKMPPETPENLRRFAKSLGGWRSMCQLPEYELKQRLQQVQA